MHTILIYCVVGSVIRTRIRYRSSAVSHLTDAANDFVAQYSNLFILFIQFIC